MSGQLEVLKVFGRRLQRQREARNWSLRDAAVGCDVSVSTIQRAEQGRELALSNAVALAALYGVTLNDLLAVSTCGRCDGMPPTGFICSECGREGKDSSNEKGERDDA